MTIRQPIVSVLGHVDHGKTSLLDYVRGTTVSSREAGFITQHIGATEVPLEHIYKVCAQLIGKRQFSVPGLLFIDTPGHQSFISLTGEGGLPGRHRRTGHRHQRGPEAPDHRVH